MKRLPLMVLLASLLSAASAQATGTADYWTGATDSTWVTGTNWSTGAAPTVSDDAIFNAVGADANVTINLGGGRMIDGLIINNTGSTVLSGGTGQSLTIYGDGVTVNSGAGGVTLSPGIFLGASQSWTNKSSNVIKVNGVTNVGNTAPYTLTLTGAGLGGFYLQGTIYDGGAIGTTGLIIDSAGTVELKLANTYSGGTAIRNGPVKLDNATSAGSGGITLGGLSTSATTVTAAAVTIANAITVSTTTTTGTLSIGNQSTVAATYSGAIALNGGNTLKIASIGSGGSTTITGGVTGTGNLTIANVNSATTLLSGTSINNTGTITNNGAGSGTTTISAAIGSNVTGVTQNSSTSSLSLSAANTYTGTTTVTSGTLIVGNNLALQNSTLSTAGSGVINATGFTTPTIGGLTGSKNLASVITTGYGSVTSLTLNPATGVSDSYSGIIANGAAGMTLFKTGAGTQTLSGSNTYSGGTTVSAGKLLFGNGITGSATGSGALSVTSSGTVGGVGTSTSSGFNIAGTVVAGSGGGSDTTGQTVIKGAAVLHNSTFANATLQFNLNTSPATPTSTSIAVGGTGIDLGSTTLSLTLVGSNTIANYTAYVLIVGMNSGSLTGVNGSQYSGITTDASGADGLALGQYKITGGLSLAFTNDPGFYSANSFLYLNTVGGVDNIEVMVVPEPTTWAMMLGGLACLLLIQNRRRKQD